MAFLVFLTMGIALWHFTVFLPDRFWQGIVGAFVGGFIFNFFGHSAPDGINFYSIFVAFVGAVVVLLIYHAVFRRRAI